MDILQASAQRRSIRRFTRQSIPREALMAMLEAARLAPTGMNRQPLQFAIVSDPTRCAQVFPHTRWAGLIPDGSAGPDESAQPAAYFALLVDKTIAPRAETDAGAAAMSVLLAAESLGLGSCWLGSIDRKALLDVLDLDPEHFAMHTVIALGYPAMQSRAVPMAGDDTTYYLESTDVLCVPKRAAADIAHWYE